MSLFAVTREEVVSVVPHPNADRLDLCRISGCTYQIVTQRGLYQVGDAIVYFPIDSLLPEPVIDRLGLWGKDEDGQVIRGKDGKPSKTMLVGADSNRVHTAILRGQPSQGFICPAAELDCAHLPKGADLTVLLGVVKHEPPPVLIPGAKLLPLPDGIGIYDIDNAEYYPDLVEAMMDEPVIVTEKLEGVNYGVGRMMDDEPFVTSRGSLIIEDEETRGDAPENPHWRVCRALALLDLLDRFAHLVGDVPAMRMLRAELIGRGVEVGNPYGLQDTTARIFDVKIGHRYVDAQDMLDLLPMNFLVPVLASNVTLRQWLAGRTLAEASNGRSLLNQDKRREGVVIRPMREMTITVQKPKRQDPDNPLSPIVEHIPVQVRAIVKQRSPEYLAKGA